MSYVVSVLGAVFGLGILIAFHELGHFLGARLIGTPVREFAVGFGTKIFSFWWGSTEFALRLIPLGGFVRAMLKEADSPEEVDAPTEIARSILNDRKNWLEHKSPWQRMIFVAAGPAFSILLAIPFYLAINTFYGEVVPSTPFQITKVSKNTPAELSGLRAGDRILAIDGVKFQTGMEVLRGLERCRGTTKLLIERDGVGQLQIEATPMIIGDHARFGVAMETKFEAVASADIAERSLSQTYQSFATQLHGIAALMTGKVGIKHTSGPVGIFKAMGSSANAGLVNYLSLLAMITVALGVFNLMPLLPLDGGHLMLILIELVTGRKVPELFMAIYAYSGIFALLTLTLFCLINDLGLIG